MLSRAGMEYVAGVVARVVEREVLSRFERLTPGDVHDKGDGDLVTTADLAVEACLEQTLTRVLPGSVVVGEERIAAEPDVLRALGNDAPVWLIDPIDGTASFVAGGRRFSTIIALCAGGSTVAGWIHAPLMGHTLWALAGRGVYLDGVRLPRGSRRPAERVTVTLADASRRTEADACIAERLHQVGVTTAGCDGVGCEYVELATTGGRAALFSWDKPWDHAAGLLAVAESGGVTMTASGESFRPAGGNALPIVVAPDVAVATGLVALLSPRASATQSPSGGDSGTMGTVSPD
ncbi:MAG TPA: inositol monophosphatase family protein [Actinomycetota bacterium]|nr:inositol monophosphatase family protein [Actinomycetota bacterium]